MHNNMQNAYTHIIIIIIIIITIVIDINRRWNLRRFFGKMSADDPTKKKKKSTYNKTNHNDRRAISIRKNTTKYYIHETFVPVSIKDKLQYGSGEVKVSLFGRHMVLVRLFPFYKLSVSRTATNKNLVFMVFFIFNSSFLQFL